MKYKVGDKVRIKSIDWYNENKDKGGFIYFDNVNFTPDMSRYCGEVLTINQVLEEYGDYLMAENAYTWTGDMIEGLVEDSNELDTKAFSDGYDQGYDDGQHDISEWNLPEGYQFVDENGNVINATKIVLEKKKPKYPTTYEECCEVLGTSGSELLFEATKATIYEITRTQLIDKLYRLLICRDAYWKIAGEKMGLRKPWKPDWEDENQEKYIIGSWLGIIQGLEENFVSHPFAFPTEEMRDAFYENFKDFIENCKEETLYDYLLEKTNIKEISKDIFKKIISGEIYDMENSPT